MPLSPGKGLSSLTQRSPAATVRVSRVSRSVAKEKVQRQKSARPLHRCSFPGHLSRADPSRLLPSEDCVPIRLGGGQLGSSLSLSHTTHFSVPSMNARIIQKRKYTPFSMHALSLCMLSWPPPLFYPRNPDESAAAGGGESKQWASFPGFLPQLQLLPFSTP